MKRFENIEQVGHLISLVYPSPTGDHLVPSAPLLHYDCIRCKPHSQRRLVLMKLVEQIAQRKVVYYSFCSVSDLSSVHRTCDIPCNSLDSEAWINRRHHAPLARLQFPVIRCDAELVVPCAREHVRYSSWCRKGSVPSRLPRECSSRKVHIP